ncbi:hypothetical protein [Escherichia coli]|uniref:hypothetical protein n=2 Tax=Escherichia coli TaxID=562 RepID=UPI000944B702|nr:hypothetical protein [Escherichia coli]OKV34986.1 hypothetical protein AWP49_05775 [Escherichia coli]OKX75479.1 hypothetical protein AWP95_03410 [Escherichia coli]
MKFKLLVVGLLLITPQLALAKDNLATIFVNEIKTAADGDGSVNATIDINCPAPSASGKVMISKSSYEFDKSVGAFVFEQSEQTPARMTTIVPMFPDEDFTSNKITGMSFIFKMPSGQFFVDILKSGKARAGVNKNGESGIKWIDCKIVKPS